jgi:hypothetical protein
MSWPPNRRKLNEHISSPMSSKDEQRHHVMDDITHGQ